MTLPIKRCAIYTRKSTEEGLGQEFNSLDAQREACAAYITSQRSEGWQLVKTQYDDGGFTGGNLDRPALKKLIENIKARTVDIIVVYKIDRLTRSLMDFAKLVEVFDEHAVTFVSVTQSFNTTTSMGRLTLNVLLSFAQFEREVISERVRDKIAASKQKGMWMGGNIPLGYDAKDRKLLINTEAANTVKLIYAYYLKTGSVFELKEHLDRNNIKSKGRKHDNDIRCGVSYSRGALYAILKNPIYIGKTRHKNKIYDGQHPPIIERDTWNQVQDKLNENSVNSSRDGNDKITALLKGKMIDCEGNRYSPSFTAKGNKRYRYYISQNLLQNRDHPKHVIARIPAESFETMLVQTIDGLLKGDRLLNILGIAKRDRTNVAWLAKRQGQIKTGDVIKHALKEAIIHEDKVILTFNWPALVKKLSSHLEVELPSPETKIYRHSVPFSVTRAGKGTGIVQAKARDGKPNPFARTPLELRNWVRGTIWRNEFFKGTMIADIAKREKIDPRYVGRLIDASLNF